MLASRASERKARAIHNTVQYGTVQYKYCTSYPFFFLALGLGPLGTPRTLINSMMPLAFLQLMHAKLIIVPCASISGPMKENR